MARIRCPDRTTWTASFIKYAVVENEKIGSLSTGNNDVVSDAVRHTVDGMSDTRDIIARKEIDLFESTDINGSRGSLTIRTVYLETTHGLDFKTPKFLHHVIYSCYLLDKENHPYMQKNCCTVRKNMIRNDVKSTNILVSM